LLLLLLLPLLLPLPLLLLPPPLLLLLLLPRLLTFEVSVQRLHHVAWQLHQAAPLLRHCLRSLRRHHHMLQFKN
jgi:hypothetical protein